MNALDYTILQAYSRAREPHPPQSQTRARNDDDFHRRNLVINVWFIACFINASHQKKIEKVDNGSFNTISSC